MKKSTNFTTRYYKSLSVKAHLLTNAKAILHVPVCSSTMTEHLKLRKR